MCFLFGLLHKADIMLPKCPSLPSPMGHFIGRSAESSAIRTRKTTTFTMCSQGGTQDGTSLRSDLRLLDVSGGEKAAMGKGLEEKGPE